MTKRNELKARRAIARWRTRNGVPAGYGAKTFNLHSVSKLLDQVLMELAQYSDKEVEIGQASDAIQEAKELISAYSEDLVTEPKKSMKRVPKNVLETKLLMGIALRELVKASNYAKQEDVIDQCVQILERDSKNIHPDVVYQINTMERLIDVANEAQAGEDFNRGQVEKSINRTAKEALAIQEADFQEAKIEYPQFLNELTAAASLRAKRSLKKKH